MLTASPHLSNVDKLLKNDFDEDDDDEDIAGGDKYQDT